MLDIERQPDKAQAQYAVMGSNFAAAGVMAELTGMPSGSHGGYATLTRIVKLNS